MKFPPCVVDRWAGGGLARRPKVPLLSHDQNNLVNQNVITVQGTIIIIVLTNNNFCDRDLTIVFVYWVPTPALTFSNRTRFPPASQVRPESNSNFEKTAQFSQKEDVNGKQIRVVNGPTNSGPNPKNSES